MKSEISISGQNFRPVRTLKPETILQAIKGIPDVLSDEADKELTYLDKLNCMKCSSKNITRTPLIINGKPAFGEYLPKNIMKCLDCSSEFEPYTKVIVK